MFRTKDLLFLLLIVFFAAFFRLYKLDTVPPGLHIDEIPFGYNAYSILQTGKDEFGAKFPFILRSYDDYRPAIMSYFTIPFVKLLDLSIISARLPSVILSLISLIALYVFTFLFVILGSIKKSRELENRARLISVATVFLYAISPWNIYMSRLALDSNLSFASFLVGLAFLFTYFRDTKLKFLLLSILSFGLSFVSYNGIKIFLPLFLTVVCFLFYDRFIKNKKHLFSAFCLTIILFVTFFLLLGKTSVIRFNSLNFFVQNEKTFLEESSKRSLYSQENNDYLGKVFDNRRFSWIPAFTTNYLVNINPTWLYADDNVHPIHKIPGVGLFHLFELFLLLVGVLVIASQIAKKFIILLSFWFFISIIPAAITIDTPNIIRIYTILPVFLIVEGFGFYTIFMTISKLKSRFLKCFSLTILTCVILISFLWFLHAYFSLLPREKSAIYHYGVADALKFAKNREDNYKQIVVSRNENLSFGYMYYLFLNKYDPASYQKTGGTKSGGFQTDHVIGKYVFTDPGIFIKEDGQEVVNEKLLTRSVKTLYIVAISDIPKDPEVKKVLLSKIKLLKTINFLDGNPAIYIFE